MNDVISLVLENLDRTRELEEYIKELKEELNEVKHMNDRWCSYFGGHDLECCENASDYCEGLVISYQGIVFWPDKFISDESY